MSDEVKMEKGRRKRRGKRKGQQGQQGQQEQDFVPGETYEGDINPEPVPIPSVEVEEKKGFKDPEEFLCPIVQDGAMEDPVVAPDGYTYEEEVIKNWFALKKTNYWISPMTGKPFSDETLIANRTLLSLIKNFPDYKKKILEAMEEKHAKEMEGLQRQLTGLETLSSSLKQKLQEAQEKQRESEHLTEKAMAQVREVTEQLSLVEAGVRQKDEKHKESLLVISRLEKELAQARSQIGDSKQQQAESTDPAEIQYYVDKYLSTESPKDPEEKKSLNSKVEQHEEGLVSQKISSKQATAVDSAKKQQSNVKSIFVNKVNFFKKSLQNVKSTFVNKFNSLEKSLEEARLRGARGRHEESYLKFGPSVLKSFLIYGAVILGILLLPKFLARQTRQFDPSRSDEGANDYLSSVNILPVSTLPSEGQMPVVDYNPYNIEGAINTQLSETNEELEIAKQAEEFYQSGRASLTGVGAPENYVEALKFFEKAGDMGHIEAQHQAGNLYSQGKKGVLQDLQKAAEWWAKAVVGWRRAAEQGNKEAQYRLGRCYEEGQGGEKDFAQALFWFQKAAEQEMGVAQFSIGMLYENGGPGVEKNPDLAQEYYQKAAKLGYELANTYLKPKVKGSIVPPKEVKPPKSDAKIPVAKQAQELFQLGNSYRETDIGRAREFWEEAGNLGHPGAQFNLGNFYAQGLGDLKDSKKAVEWWTKAADRGYVGAQFNLGLSYDEGEGVEKDFKQAAHWFKKAAEQGFKHACSKLGSYYEEGLGVEKNHEQAVYWWQEAARLGSSKAKNILQTMDHDIPVASIGEKAVTRSSDAFFQPISVSQMYELGKSYALGQGVPRNPEEAVKWWQKAAEQENVAAQFNLGVCYENGVGVLQNSELAVFWYTKAAEQGHAVAQYYLGNCYAQGEGVPKDYQLALHWYIKAAEQGVRESCFFIGDLYRHGHGVVKDAKQAEAWYAKAKNLDGSLEEKYDVPAVIMVTRIIEESMPVPRLG